MTIKKGIYIFFMIGFIGLYAGVTDIPKDLTSPWLAFKGEPPGNGAIGVMVWDLERSDSRKLQVYWVAEGVLEYQDQSVFMDNLNYGDYGMNRGETCRQLLVFDQHHEWVLLHASRGWAWASIKQKENQPFYCDTAESVSLLEVHLRERIFPEEERRKQYPDLIIQDYALSEDELFIKLSTGPVYLSPDESAPVLCQLPIEWTWQWIHPPDKGISKISQLRFSGESQTNELVPIRILSMKGDWLQVQLPIKGTKAYRYSTIHAGAVEEEVSTNIVCWDRTHVGWVRWRKSGPLPGTYLHLILDMHESPTHE